MFVENRNNLPPGYTGHIPFRNDLIGLTTGEANKSSLQQYEISTTPTGQLYNMAASKIMSNRGQSGLDINTSKLAGLNQDILNETLDPMQYYKNQKLLSVGNKSRNAASWIGGPKHEIRTQRIPGYTGFMPGIQSENLFGKSYSKCSAASISNKIERGFDMSPQKRYLSQNQKAFADKHFRRIVERPDLINKRDYHEYTMTLNQQESDIRQKTLDISLPNITPAKRNQEYFDPSNQTLSPPKSINPMTNNFYLQSNDIQVKPILLEKKLAERDEYKNLSEGFKRIFAQDDQYDQKDIVIPVCGYTGHRKGSRAENIFGKSFREASIQSKKLERVASLNKSQFVR